MYRESRKSFLYIGLCVIIIGLTQYGCSQFGQEGEVITEDCPDNVNSELLITGTEKFESKTSQGLSLQITRIEKSELGDDSLKIKVFGHVVDNNGKLLTGLNEQAYKKYWCKVTDSSVAKSDNVKRFRVNEFLDRDRTPMGIVLVLDHSGSMGQYRARKMQEAVTRFIKKYKAPDDRVAIVKFDNNIKSLSIPDPRNSNEWNKFAEDFEVGLVDFGGMTALKDGIGKGLELLANPEFSNLKRKHILAITDGFENSSVSYETKNLVETANKNNVNISTIAFGDYVDKILLADSIAASTYGSYHYICSTNDFDFLFEDIYLRLTNYYSIEYATPIYYGLHAVNIDLCLTDQTLQATNYYYVEPPKIDDKIRIRNIYFDFDKATIKMDSSKDAINRIYYLMKTYPELDIEIQGHTDSSGTDKYNDDLSLRRANAVRTALVKLGIKEERMKTEGKGRRYPVVAEYKLEENRAMNRRVEFIIKDSIPELMKRSIPAFLTPTQSSR
ncbi:MAG TPA: OmpA family protein [Ignavibacteriaceae bacterium]|nr:OmpA family protein [Ignavibacteriaceae bacterium]